jgi:putative molybdopterin biosynthesis protein
MKTYLGTEEAAAYLGIRERKLYELAAAQRIPCSKVTGKWLFPRAALDRWVESGLAMPQGFAPSAPPPIIAGSHDPLLEWAARRSGSGMALLSEGSEAGLRRFDRGEAILAALHLHAEIGADEGANSSAVRALHQGHDTVLIAFARREQGLLLKPGNPLAIAGFEDALRLRGRFGFRQPGAGAQGLLDRLLLLHGKAQADLDAAPEIFVTGQDLAFAVRSGEIDCGIATRAVALAAGLDFAPILWEEFDLVLQRRSYFEPGPQMLFAFMRGAEFHRQAASFGGYETGMAGQVRLNR